MLLCPRCKLRVDHPGYCLVCREVMGVDKQYRCIVCGAPFPEGRPHRKCLEKMRKAAEWGEGLPGYWRRQKKRGKKPEQAIYP